MIDVERLLAEATPLPWETDEVNGEYCIRNEDGEAIVPWTGLTNDINYRLIVYAVNRLPDYEAAVDALERLLDALVLNPTGYIIEVEVEQAKDRLARLREKVPA